MHLSNLFKHEMSNDTELFGVRGDTGGGGANTRLTKVGSVSSAHADRYIDIQTDRQTYRQTDRQTDRHTYIHTYIHTYKH